MKMSKAVLLSASLWIAVFFISGTVFAARSAMDAIKKKQPEASMMVEDSGMKKVVAEEMESTMKAEMAEPMKADMEESMDQKMEEPMKADMEATMKTEMEEPMKSGMEEGMKKEMVKPMNSEKK